MIRMTRWAAAAGGFLNLLAGAAVILMMLLTCADVVLRLLRLPIPGTYEMIGYLGSAVIVFALAYTTLEKGHIAVEILTERLPRRLQVAIEFFSTVVSLALFSLITWQSLLYAEDLRKSGEVSVTLALPIYPFLYGMTLGCCFLCLVLLCDVYRQARRHAL